VVSVENRTWLVAGSSVVQRIVASVSLARSTRTLEIAGAVVSADAEAHLAKSAVVVVVAVVVDGEDAHVDERGRVGEAEVEGLLVARAGDDVEFRGGAIGCFQPHARDLVPVGPALDDVDADELRGDAEPDAPVGVEQPVLGEVGLVVPVEERLGRALVVDPQVGLDAAAERHVVLGGSGAGGEGDQEGGKKAAHRPRR
jgi:hypothetical protein